MKSRVSLTIEESVLHDIKIYARKQGTSVSEIVENHLRNITKLEKHRNIIDMVEELNPANIDPKADLTEMYHRERAKKYGF